MRTGRGCALPRPISIRATATRAPAAATACRGAGSHSAKPAPRSAPCSSPPRPHAGRSLPTDLHAPRPARSSTSARDGDSATASSPAAAATVPVPASVVLKPKSAWRILGKDRHGIDLGDITHGRAQYGLDVKVPGMLYASIERATVFGADGRRRLTTPRRGRWPASATWSGSSRARLGRARRRRGPRRQHLGRDGRTTRAQGHLERRRACERRAPPRIAPRCRRRSPPPAPKS